MAQLYMPNMLASFNQGVDRGEERRFNQLAGQAVTAQGEQRNSLLGQLASLDPARGMAVGDKLQARESDKRQKLAGAAKYMLGAVESKNPAAVQGAWQTVRPFLEELVGPQGKVVPEQWDPNMEPLLHRAIAAAGGTAESGANVQSRFVDAQGNVMALMRDGSVRDLGIKADPNMQIIEGAGGFYGVNKRSLEANPVQVGAPAVPRAPGEVPFSIDPRLPPEVQQAIRSNPDAGSAQGITSLPMQGGGGQLQAAPDQPSATFSPLNSDEIRALGLPAGTVAQRNLQTGEVDVIQSPPTVDIKAQQEAQKKLPQLQNAVRGVQRIEQALQGLGGMFTDTGPLDQFAQRFTPAGQELEAAVGAIQNSMLALTRVPGVGSQSDLEQRVAQLQYPSLDKAPEVNARTMENLRAFVRDLEAAYQNVLSEGGPAAPQQPAQPGGWAIEVVD